MFSVCPSVRPFVCLLPNCEHDIFKKNESTLMQKLAQVVQGAKTRNDQLGGRSGGQRLRSQEAEKGHKNSLRNDSSRIIRQIIMTMLLQNIRPSVSVCLSATPSVRHTSGILSKWLNKPFTLPSSHITPVCSYRMA